MKKILLCLAALLCVTVVSAQEDDLTPVELALMVGKTNDAIKARAEYVDTMPSGVEVYRRINVYDKIEVAYYCTFDSNGRLENVWYNTPHALGWELSFVLSDYKDEIGKSKNEKYDPMLDTYMRHTFPFRNTWVVFDHAEQRVYVYKKK